MGIFLKLRTGGYSCSLDLPQRADLLRFSVGTPSSSLAGWCGESRVVLNGSQEDLFIFLLQTVKESLITEYLAPSPLRDWKVACKAKARVAEPLTNGRIGSAHLAGIFGEPLWVQEQEGRGEDFRRIFSIYPMLMVNVLSEAHQTAPLTFWYNAVNNRVNLRKCAWSVTFVYCKRYISST